MAYERKEMWTPGEAKEMPKRSFEKAEQPVQREASPDLGKAQVLRRDTLMGSEQAGAGMENGGFASPEDQQMATEIQRKILEVKNNPNLSREESLEQRIALAEQLDPLFERAEMKALDQQENSAVEQEGNTVWEQDEVPQRASKAEKAAVKEDTNTVWTERKQPSEEVRVFADTPQQEQQPAQEAVEQSAEEEVAQQWEEARKSAIQSGAMDAEGNILKQIPGWTGEQMQYLSGLQRKWAENYNANKAPETSFDSLVNPEERARQIEQQIAQAQASMERLRASGDWTGAQQQEGLIRSLREKLNEARNTQKRAA